MTKFRKLEDAQAAILQIQADPGANLETLRTVLASKHPVAIAQAAKLIATAELVELCPDLVTAFDRLFTKSSDPGCIGKQAIADALYRLECNEADLFVRGIRHIQQEPVWGGQVDTAPKLRGICALGLVRMNYSDLLNELADLLADSEPEARIGAARAIAYSDRPEGVALLRLRVKLGDDAAVMAEYFDALLKLAADSAIALVSSFLSDLEPLQEAAALALGSSRSIAALTPLQTWWQQCRSAELRQTALLAIAMLRHDQAIEFLLNQIAVSESRDAKDAIAALRIYQQDTALWERVELIVQQRGDRTLLEAIAAKPYHP
ncbi:MAG: hypothetical protein F6K28_42980 [Microcoleus sp. SIO2G3]|nr:hypothetical protein [Microcoleus sp. SIO2G3]